MKIVIVASEFTADVLQPDSGLLLEGPYLLTQAWVLQRRVGRQRAVSHDASLISHSGSGFMFWCNHNTRRSI